MYLHRIKLGFFKLGLAALTMLIMPLNTGNASFKPYEVAVYLRIANFIRWNDESSMNLTFVIGDEKVSQVLTSIQREIIRSARHPRSTADYF
ncbi:hypothetical protein O9929_25480 [Vibrio lentus]|nr:hypothetical protein [Vibrio lentus]